MRYVNVIDDNGVLSNTEVEGDTSTDLRCAVDDAIETIVDWVNTIDLDAPEWCDYEDLEDDCIDMQSRVRRGIEDLSFDIVCEAITTKYGFTIKIERD